MNVLMVGVDKERIGGMWSVAETFIESQEFNDKVSLYYVATSTCGSKMKRVCKMLTGYMKILWLLLIKKIDIVHIHMAEKGSVFRKGFIVKLSKLFGKKVIVQMHAGPIMAWYETLSEGNKRRVKDILNAPDKLLVLGKYWKERLMPLVPAEKMTVLYNGVSCQDTNPYNVDGNYILYLGLLKKSKGTYDLVDAISRIDKELSTDIKVYLCGYDEEGNMPQYVRERGLEHRVVLPGWINKEQKEELFKNTQISVLPSYFEALSMTVIEAMANGIPMITTNISTMPELLGDSVERIEPGDIIGLSELILKFNKDRDLRKQISNTEFERAVRQFNIKKNIENILDIYETILSGVLF